MPKSKNHEAPNNSFQKNSIFFCCKSGFAEDLCDFSAVWLGEQIVTFRRTVLPSSSGSCCLIQNVKALLFPKSSHKLFVQPHSIISRKTLVSKISVRSCDLIHCLFTLLFQFVADLYLLRFRLQCPCGSSHIRYGHMCLRCVFLGGSTSDSSRCMRSKRSQERG